MTDSCKYQLISPGSAGESADLLEGKAEGDSLRRIQALLAEWAAYGECRGTDRSRMLGSLWRSPDAGPSDNNLECLVLDAVAKCDISADAAKVIDWKKTSDFGGGSFEAWLSYVFNATGFSVDVRSPFESVNWKGGASPSAQDQEQLCSLIEKAIYAECALELNFDELKVAGDASTSGHIPFLAKLIARDATLGRTHLFTLNYDTLFEQAMEELGIQYFDGFTGKANSRFDPSVYGLDIYYPGDVAEGRVRRFDKFLQFYKLHGSIHWKREEAERFGRNISPFLSRMTTVRAYLGIRQYSCRASGSRRLPHSESCPPHRSSLRP